MNNMKSYGNDRMYEDNKVFITEEEERDLYKRMKEGCLDSRDNLIMGHKYLVVKIARQYAPYGSYEDLLQEGFIGLIRAVDKYDVNVSRLRTYSYPSIQQQMLRFLNKTRHIIRLPEPQTYALLKLLRIKTDMEKELGREPSTRDFMDNPQVIEDHEQFKKSTKSKISLKEYVGLLEYGNRETSLNTPILEDSEAELQDFVEDPRQQSEFERIEIEDLNNAIMDELEDREIFILKSLAKGMTGQEVGDQLGITTQSVSAIKLSSVKKIRWFVKKHPELKEVVSNLGFKI